ncbi:unnamed protein product [Caenorhabditis auriculariae]|uniref:Chondroitin proteoglycan 4 domain-containing protein n=1 Tax=Caenorhabditis auriculariae TaxID=2777116 RepID=A0A8S1HAM1_9PELO|nr:unnamed protein product [Caenorhabditis auriculariae]
MLRQVLICLLVSLASARLHHQLDPYGEEEEELDVNTILKALGTPLCMRKCIDPFIKTTSAIWNMKDVAGNSRTVCSSHSKALACLKADQFCDMKGVFKTASSSVHYMCDRKSLLFERMEACLKPVVDTIMQECDSTCHARSNLTAFSQNSNIKFAAQIGGNIFIVSDHLGPLCGSLACTLPCITKKLNDKCDLSGWLTLDVLMQPLDATAAIVEDLPVSLRDLLHQKIDKRCSFTLSTARLNRIRNGDFNAFY